jgi:hypothetical protein
MIIPISHTGTGRASVAFFLRSRQRQDSIIHLVELLEAFISVRIGGGYLATSYLIGDLVNLF